MWVVETMYNVFSFYNFIFTTNTCQMEAIESIELDYQCLPIMHNLCNDKIIEYNCNSFTTLSIESPYYNYEDFNNKVINPKQFSTIHISHRA